MTQKKGYPQQGSGKAIKYMIGDFVVKATTLNKPVAL